MHIEVISHENILENKLQKKTNKKSNFSYVIWRFIEPTLFSNFPKVKLLQTSHNSTTESQKTSESWNTYIFYLFSLHDRNYTACVLSDRPQQWRHSKRFVTIFFPRLRDHNTADRTKMCTVSNVEKKCVYNSYKKRTMIGNGRENVSRIEHWAERDNKNRPINDR